MKAQVKHAYQNGEHLIDITDENIQSHVVEAKEETAASEDASMEAERCPAHGYGNCHFMCCSECRSSGVTYKKDWTKYQATLITVKYDETFVVCPLCEQEIILSKKKQQPTL